MNPPARGLVLNADSGRLIPTLGRTAGTVSVPSAPMTHPASPIPTVLFRSAARIGAPVPGGLLARRKRRIDLSGRK